MWSEWEVEGLTGPPSSKALGLVSTLLALATSGLRLTLQLTMSTSVLGGVGCQEVKDSEAKWTPPSTPTWEFSCPPGYLCPRPFFMATPLVLCGQALLPA